MSNDLAAVDAVAGVSFTAGRFWFWFAGQRWEWSGEAAALHGYPAESMTPTMDQVLGHKHPADRAAVAEVLDAMVRTGQAFCSRHRIIDTGGVERQVLVVGEQMRDEAGAVVGSTGYYIDLTAAAARDRAEAIDEAIDEVLPEVLVARAVIEQAKGAVMAMYGVSAEQAFNVLSWRSQETNTKLRVLAGKLVAALREFAGGSPQTRTRFDHLLLTAHERPDPSSAEEDSRHGEAAVREQ
ncbi:PAS and ANTAR domain-containing protein [Nocardia shimofusensis]|uniref:PAS and ANTAR domain-containing protein n=1 Tax=Nocardia shimofusensis TaxID=228596 RepID=UPI0008367709|nr:PAS and ANTAR domain-containing protein [Nocardia shimofusensis]